MRLREKRSKRRRARRIRPYPELYTEVSQPEGIPLVVGLGNPGSKYRRTRHNVGSEAIDRLREIVDIIDEYTWPQGWLALAQKEDQRFILFKPLTFMNLSGAAVEPVCRHYLVAADDVLVLHDDMDISYGEVRRKAGGGSAGHRGVDSLIQALGEGGFHRLRIGIGRPAAETDPVDHVLTQLSPEERDELPGGLELASQLSFDFLEEKVGKSQEDAGE